MYRSQLNINAAIFNLDKSRISIALKDFFSILFIKWPGDNIENIIVKLSNTVDEMNEVEKVFKELFLNVYYLASQFQAELNCNNIILTINALDMFLPEILINKLNKTSDEFLLDYEQIKKRAFQECFSRIKALFELFRECKYRSTIVYLLPIEIQKNSIISNKILIEINNILMILINLCKIKYFQLFVYAFASFLWEMFYEYHDLSDIRLILLECFSKIFPKLVMFLLIIIDEKNCMEASEFVLNSFRTLKSDLINCRFSEKEADCILKIIDQHDQFIGKYFDRNPENIYEDGFVVCSSVTKSFETEDYYEDYENFLLNRVD